YNAANWPDETAMQEKEFGIWIEYTWRDYQYAAEHFALGMTALGLQRGDIVGIVGDNRPEWVHCELGTQAAGAMSLGIYQDSLGGEVEYLLNYARVKIIMCEDEEQVDKVLELADVCPSIEY